MSEVFTASNGVEVERAAGGGDLCIFGARRDFICHEHEVALREFFLHERDKTLGRWRSPTGFYVYPLGEINGERVVQVLDEQNGQSHGFSEGGEFKGLGIFYEAANDYFAAHPESKPWHDAETGEVWLLTLEDGEEQPWYVDGGPDFNPIPWHKDIICMNRASSRISAGRKVWPEVSGE